MEDHSPPGSAPVALAIAGSDSGANAGIQADLLTFAANGVYGTTAITCLTAQNPNGITSIKAMTADFVVEQIKQVALYHDIGALKTGMLFSSEIIQAVSNYLKSAKNSENPSLRIVVDPVMVASSGDSLLQSQAIEDYQSALLPLADLITPNLDEAKALLNRDLPTIEEIKAGAGELASRFDCYALVKGGHLPGDQLFDILASPNGATETYEQGRIHAINTHGSGCTLSAACAAQLALGKSVGDAVSAARAYLRRGMETPIKTPRAKVINHSV